MGDLLLRSRASVLLASAALVVLHLQGCGPEAEQQPQQQARWKSIEEAKSECEAPLGNQPTSTNAVCDAKDIFSRILKAETDAGSSQDGRESQYDELGQLMMPAECCNGLKDAWEQDAAYSEKNTEAIKTRTPEFVAHARKVNKLQVGLFCKKKCATQISELKPNARQYVCDLMQTLYPKDDQILASDPTDICDALSCGPVITEVCKVAPPSSGDPAPQAAEPTTGGVTMMQLTNASSIQRIQRKRNTLQVREHELMIARRSDARVSKDDISEE